MSWSGQGASAAQERILPVLVVAEANGCDSDSDRQGARQIRGLRNLTKC